MLSDDQGQIAWDVTLNHLEVIALLMLLELRAQEDGLSEPEISARDKLYEANVILQNLLRLT